LQGKPIVDGSVLESADRLDHLRDMSVADTIRRKLTERFAPMRLEIDDESHRHAGHEGARPGGETHFSVTIVSAAFSGQSRIARQRLVYQTLAEELATRVHALSLTTLAPDEDRLSGS
jgi:BolA family transcriptional regulator, general stress-responsive regulator